MSKPKMNRRQFLTVAGVGGVATAGVVAQQALTGAGVKAPEATPVGKHGGKGYELTEHIRNYYRTTQV